jgi:outer membrane protein OmpA-like peptidoglycan-associated protein
MTASGASSRSEDTGISGILTARWPTPVRYAVAAGFLLIGVGALATIDLVLLPRYFSASTQAVLELQPSQLGPATVPIAPRGVVLANPETQAKERALARPGSAPVAPSARAASSPATPPAFPHLLFAMKDARISPAAERILERVASALKQDRRLHVVLSGHTDDLGTAAFNAVLSLQRAQQSAKWLERYGVASERIETHGFGATRPLDHSLSLGARAHNRRVEIDLR